VNRTSQFIAKNFDSKVPEVNEDFISYWKNKIEFLDNNYAEIPDKAHLGEDFDNILNENDKLVLTALWQGIEKSKINFSKFKVREAYLEIMNIARASNKYFNDEAPWKSIKENKELAAKTLYVCAQLIGSLSVLFAPALPNAARKLQTLLEIPLEIGSSNNANPIENHWEKVKNPTLLVGGKFDIKDILFPNIEDEVIEKQVAKLGANNEKPAQQSAEVFDLISIDDFRKVKLRTAKVLEAEKVPKSDKLLKLQIQIGEEKRQLIAGIAQHYTPEQMVGKVIIVVANLQPAKLFGNLSQGMLLAAKSPDGKLSLITVEESGFPSGADVS
jgi:methionyl-tRNA synthetase